MPYYKHKRAPLLIRRFPWIILGIISCITLLHFVPAFYDFLTPLWPTATEQPSAISLTEPMPISIPEQIKQSKAVNSISDYEEIFNEYRESNGLYPLKFSEDLKNIAELRLIELKADFSHTSKYNEYLGENIACCVDNDREALNLWQESTLHNMNLLDNEYKYTGYTIGGGYAVQVFSSWETINGIPQLPPGWFFVD